MEASGFSMGNTGVDQVLEIPLLCKVGRGEVETMNHHWFSETRHDQSASLVLGNSTPP